ncbi:Inner membrane complex family protein [Babesia bovis T2Bo]|uniref:Membrane skeletal protein n=1 Tax=Babesia bovis TaxID=5865 RepID=A7AWM7_BABBO|nr:Inner membrane complex family protein [Babesia bovis T2Bo]EDO05455.1 Inner membrane complex family protein [Babesia bovis T2Bo]|eukprot:XP_001609023.1 hypothetical protein [Babesia bovis T2Bo]
MSSNNPEQLYEGQGPMDQTVFQGNLQSYTMPNNISMAPPTDFANYMAPPPELQWKQRTVTKKNKSRFPCNLCCCCYGEEETVPVKSNLVGDANRSIVLKPIRRERIVEVMKEEIQERVVNVPQIQYVDKFVEVPKPIFKYKIKEVKRPVIVEKIKRVPKIVEEEKIIEVPEIKYVEKEVEVPHIVKKEKVVEVPLPIVRERRIPVLRLKKDEKYQEVENINYEDFETNIMSNRYGSEAPNNTPIKLQARDIPNNTQEMSKTLKGVYSSNENDNFNRWEEQYDNGSKVDIDHHRPVMYYNNPVITQVTDNEKVSTSRRTVTKDNTLREQYKVSSPTTERKDIGVNNNGHYDQRSNNESIVTEIISVRGISNRSSPKMNQYDVEPLIEDIDEQLVNRDIIDEDNYVSIYPNIDAMSIKDGSSVETKKQQTRTSQEAQNSESGTDAKSMKKGDHRSVEEQITHVRITK